MRSVPATRMRSAQILRELALAMGLHLLLSSPTAAGTTAEPALPAASQAGSIVWDPAVVSLGPACASSFWRIPRSPLCIIELALDSSGDLHLFTAWRPLNLDVVVDRSIEHYLLSEDGVHPLASIPLEHAPVRALSAVASAGGEMLLSWAEEEFYAPDYREPAIYLRRYRDGAWGTAQSVLDDRAEPYVLGQADIDLVANADGAIDLFWTDIREHHFLVALATMGHGGDYQKTYHRRLDGDQWGKVERIQRRGTFEPFIFRVLPNVNGVADVFWSDSTRSASTVFRSTHARGRWTVEEAIGVCKSPLGRPHVVAIDLTTDVGRNSKVAWQCTGYEFTEPGTRRNDSFSHLYVSALDDGVWRPGRILSRNVHSFRWLHSDRIRSVLLLQESMPSSYPPRRTTAPLFVQTIEGDRPIARSLLSGRSLPDLVEAVTGPDGAVHVVFAEPISEAEAVLVYRRGKYRSEQPR